MKKLLLVLLIIIVGSASAQNLSVTNLISNNMVLQRNAQTTVWGTNAGGTVVTVNPSWGPAKNVTTGSNGKWSVKIPTGNAGGPFNISVSDNNENKNFTNVMIGEVWVCSGQSNMDMPLSGWGAQDITNSAQEIANANFPNLRVFKVNRAAAWDPKADYSGIWRVSRPSVAGGFSAVAYLFGKKLHQELNIPVGIVVSAKGSSAGEAWTPLDYVTSVTGFGNAAAEISSSKAGNGPWKISHINNDSEGFLTPAALYNGMIAPITPYTIKGINWYQGETNVGREAQYRELLPALIDGWRSKFNQGNLPFNIVQICPFSGYNNGNRKSQELREAQLLAANSLANTELAVTVDVGDANRIHPPNKTALGNRLAFIALNRTYGRSSTVYSGPAYSSTQFTGNQAIISFNQINGGLSIQNGGGGFQVAGNDNVYHNATASVVGDKLHVSSSSESNPVKVRYGWSNYFNASLFNANGLPASSFRSDPPSTGGGNNGGDSTPLTCTTALDYNGNPNSYSPGERVVNTNDNRLYERTATGWTFIEQCNASSAPLTCATAPDYNGNPNSYSLGERVVNINDNRLYERTATGWTFIEQCNASSTPLTCATAPDYNGNPNSYSLGERVVNTNDNRLYERTATSWTFIEQCSAGARFGAMEEAEEHSVGLYPNAADHVLTVSGVRVGSIIQILDLGGKVQYSGVASEIQETISVSGLNAGVYIVKINGAQTLKFIKK